MKQYDYQNCSHPISLKKIINKTVGHGLDFAKWSPTLSRVTLAPKFVTFYFFVTGYFFGSSTGTYPKFHGLLLEIFTGYPKF